MFFGEGSGNYEAGSAKERTNEEMLEHDARRKFL